MGFVKIISSSACMCSMLVLAACTSMSERDQLSEFDSPAMTLRQAAQAAQAGQFEFALKQYQQLPQSYRHSM